MEDKLLDARGLVGWEGEPVRGFVDVEERGKSTDARGVEASEYVIDLRRAGGKNPKALRGIRAICVGFLSFDNSTQESCFQGVSDSALDDSTEVVSSSFGGVAGTFQPFGSPALFGMGVLLVLSPKSPKSKSS